MATRSTISVICNDGKVLSAYCHFDGYPSNNGKLLDNNYNTYELALELVSRGNMSYLGDSIESTKFYSEKPTQFSCEADYSLSRKLKEEFNYLFKDGRWILHSRA